MSGVVTTEENIENVRAVYLTADDLKVAASILYNAYFDDPLFMEIFQAEREGYESRLRSAIREELTTFWNAEQPMVGLFEESRMLSVACLTRPCAAFGADRFWHWRLKMLLTAGFFGTRQMVEKEEKVRACMPASKYHMLSFIAVHPDHQHHGLGHQLMGAIDSILEHEVDSEGVGVFATVPKYRSFFEHGNYQSICNLEIGQVSGEIMFKKRSG